MKKVLTAVQLFLGDLKQLETPATATAVAGILVPVIASVAGVHVTAAEVGGWLLLIGSVAAVVQKLFSGQAAAAVRAGR